MRTQGLAGLVTADRRFDAIGTRVRSGRRTQSGHGINHPPCAVNAGDKLGESHRHRAQDRRAALIAAADEIDRRAGAVPQPDA